MVGSSLHCFRSTTTEPYTTSRLATGLLRSAGRDPFLAFARRPAVGHELDEMGQEGTLGQAMERRHDVGIGERHEVARPRPAALGERRRDPLLTPQAVA